MSGGEGTPTALDPALREALAAFASRPSVLVALDFDGTLAPLRVDPMTSAILPAARPAIENLAGARGVSLALVSGRILRDLHLLAQMPAGTWLVGSHGAERGRVAADGSLDLEPFALPAQQVERLAQMRARLERVAAQVPGAWVEHKPVAEVLHTRPVSDKELAERTLSSARQVGAELDAIVITGHDVVELTAIEVSKGTALRRLREDIGPDAVLYAGDDVTDENAFAVLEGADVGIRVGSGVTRATWSVADVATMAQALTALAELRASA